MVKVKICGITNLSDALMCAEAGADALGFVFYEKSPRKVSLADAGEILKQLPLFVEPVAVVVDGDTDLLLRIKALGFNTFQVYFPLTEGLVSLFPGSIFIQAKRVRSREYIPADLAKAVLIDAYDEANMGGTGKSIDYKLAEEIRLSVPKPMILAGGLGEDNVGQAVERVRPYGVDASSRLEIKPGRKDAEKVRNFIHSAKCVVL